jgi:hypothetical protein
MARVARGSPDRHIVQVTPPTLAAGRGRALLDEGMRALGAHLVKELLRGKAKGGTEGAQIV